MVEVIEGPFFCAASQVAQRRSDGPVSRKSWMNNDVSALLGKLEQGYVKITKCDIGTVYEHLTTFYQEDNFFVCLLYHDYNLYLKARSRM